MTQARYPYFRLIAATAALLALSGCLKTRAQLKDDDETDKGLPGTVEPVRTQNNYVIDELKSEITRLTGRVEDLERDLQDKEKKDKESSGEALEQLKTRITELENTQATMLSELKKLQDRPPDSDSGESFEKGKRSFNDKDYKEAINSFNLYLKNPEGEHVEEATFLRGESYYNLKQYKKAIIDYSKFTEKFTRSKRMPEVLWKIAQSFENLEMKDDAKLFYQELVDKFPGTPRSNSAKRRLAGGGRSGKK